MCPLNVFVPVHMCVCLSVYPYVCMYTCPVPNVRTTQTGQVNLPEGSNLSLNCSVTNSPYLDVVSLIWTFDGNDIRNAYVQVNDGPNTVSVLSASNLGSSGTYRCVLSYRRNTMPGTTSTAGASLLSSSDAVEANLHPVSSEYGKYGTDMPGTTCSTGSSLLEPMQLHYEMTCWSPPPCRGTLVAVGVHITLSSTYTV